MIEIIKLDTKKKYIFSFEGHSQDFTDRFKQYLIKLGFEEGNVLVVGSNFNVHQVKDGKENDN